MFKRMFLAVTLMVAVFVAQVGAVQADTDVKKTISKALFGIFMLDVKPTYGDVQVIKSENKIVVSDISWDQNDTKVRYKRIEIIGFNESKPWEYTIQKILFFEGSSSVPNPYPDPKLLSSQIMEIKIGSATVNNVSMSRANQIMKVGNVSVNGMKLPFPQSRSGFLDLTLEYSNMKITNVEKVTKAAKAYMKTASKLTDPTSLRTNPTLADEFGRNILVVFKNFSVDSMVISGFQDINGPNGRINLGSIYLRNLKDGIADEIGLRGLAVYGFSEKPMTKFNNIAVKKLDFPGLIQHSLNVVKRPETAANPETGLKFFRYFGGLAFHGFEASYPTNPNLKVNIDVDWSNFVGLFPTKYSLFGDLSFDIAEPAAKAGENFSFNRPRHVFSHAKFSGLDKLGLKFENRIEWEEKSNRVVISPVIYDLDKLFSISYSVSIENVTRDLLLTKDPRSLTLLAMGTKIGPMTIEIKDKGAQKIFGVLAKKGWDKLVEVSKSDPKLAPVIADISRLIEQPNGALKIVLKPKGDLTLAQLSAALTVDPKGLSSYFEISTSFSAK